MAIDTNIGTIYNEGFPVAGVDQSSQGFRDNFTVIKRAIENLQGMSASGSSVFSIAASIGTGGEVRVNVGYKDNALRLPTGSPDVTPEQGMLRHTNGVLQIHNGSGWQTTLTTDTQGGVTIPGNAYLLLPAGFTSDRPASAQDGMIRYNESLGIVEVFKLGEWVEVGSGSSGGDLSGNGGTITGVLNLLTDANLPTQAVNFRTMKNYATNMFVPRPTGVSAAFNQVTNAVTLTAMPFNIELTGQVTGNGIVNDLNDVQIDTLIPDMLTIQEVRDTVGDLITGTIRDPFGNTSTESGIIVNYDAVNNTLELAVREFDVILQGVITGSGHSARLKDIIIDTSTTTLITGLTVYDENVILGAPASVQEFNFSGGGVSAVQTGNSVNVVVEAGLTLQDVRDEVGGFISGTIRDPDANATTESGIFVNYDALNQRLEIYPRDFTITLDGDIQGSGLVTRLNNTTIMTTSNFIRGITVYDEFTPIGAPQSVQTLNFVGNAITATQTNNSVTVTVADGITAQGVRDIVGGFVSGTILDPVANATTESGIFVVYDQDNNRLEVYPRDFTITIDGAVTGNATISRLNNATIMTTTDLIKGIMVEDEGVAIGLPQSVQTLNFTGGGVTASQLAEVVTIDVPQGLTDQNVRDIVGGGFVSGTVFDQNANATTESGIFVVYDQDNNRLQIYPRDFTITLDGAVTGSAIISRLNNATITTSTDLIKGIMVEDEGSALGLPQSVQTLNFTGGGVTATQLNEVVTIDVPQGLTDQNVRDVVGGFVSGTILDPVANATTESGIFVNYDADNNRLEIYPRDFTVTLAGAVTGSAVISRLNNATITTSTDLIKGIMVEDEGVPTGLPQTVQTLNFVGGGISASQTGNTVNVVVEAGLSDQDVRDVVGTFVSGTIRDPNTLQDTESGISVFYDADNNRLEVAPRDFTITLTGRVQGNGIVSRLGNVSIATTTDAITGITALDEGLPLGASNAIQTVNFTGGGVTALQNGNLLTVNVPSGLTDADVRDTVGSFIQGTIRDPSTLVSTESGIEVFYDSSNNVLELAPRDFTISLTGAVTGSGTVSRLNNVAISTTADFLKGVTVETGGVLLGTTVKTFNFIGANASVSANTATIQLNATVAPSDIIPVVNTLIVGTQHTGLIASYDSPNSRIKLSLNPLTVSLIGAVTGSGTVSYGANSSTLSISTAVSDLGITIQDEGTTAGTVSAVNFVGGGVTSAVSIDGHIATVFIPNSPGNEEFLLVNYGSANVPNARKLVSGTGILINDGGPGGDLTISAESDAIIARVRYLQDDALVAERPTVNIVSTQEIVTEIDDDSVNNQINISIFSLSDGWYRPNSIECGYISDKYGPSIDMGSLQSGIIETDADMGTLQG